MGELIDAIVKEAVKLTTSPLGENGTQGGTVGIKAFFGGIQFGGPNGDTASTPHDSFLNDGLRY